MEFTKSLIKGKLVKRYKRFFVDIEYKDKIITAHCPNSGSMMGLLKNGNDVWFSESNNPKRKLKYTLEIIDVDNKLVGINTQLTNTIVLEALNKKGYKKVIFVVGSDRVNEFQRNMSKYVDSDLDNIQDFSVVSAGDRDPDAEGVAGMSGSKMREFVIKGQFGKFKEGLMTKNSRLAKAVFKEIGKKLKTTKEI